MYYFKLWKQFFNFVSVIGSVGQDIYSVYFQLTMIMCSFKWRVFRFQCYCTSGESGEQPEASEASALAWDRWAWRCRQVAAPSAGPLNWPSTLPRGVEARPSTLTSDPNGVQPGVCSHRHTHGGHGGVAGASSATIRCTDLNQLPRDQTQSSRCSRFTRLQD